MTAIPLPSRFPLKQQKISIEAIVGIVLGVAAAMQS